LQNLKSLPA